MIDRNLKGVWWWGYLHSNGTIQLKRWWGDHQDYTSDCQGNPNVKAVVRPFMAADFETAKKILQSHFKRVP